MVTPLLIYGIINIRTNISEIRSNTYNENLKVAENISTEVDSIFAESEKLLKIATKSDGINSMLAMKMIKFAKKH